MRPLSCTATYVSDFAAGVVASGISFGPDGRLYAADFVNNRVVRFEGRTGAPDVSFEASGCGLDGPSGLAFMPDGTILVASQHTHEVIAFDAVTGRDCCVAGSGCGVDTPVGLLLLPEGRLLVSSFGSDAVVEFSLARPPADRCVGNLVKPGSCGLAGPQGIGLGPDGSVYVASPNSDSILRFDSSTGDPGSPCVVASGCPVAEPTFFAFGQLCGEDPASCHRSDPCGTPPSCTNVLCYSGTTVCNSDCTGDGQLDPRDNAWLVGCMDGPASTTGCPICRCADLNNDDVIDLRDVGVLQREFLEH